MSGMDKQKRCDAYLLERLRNGTVPAPFGWGTIQSGGALGCRSANSSRHEPIQSELRAHPYRRSLPSVLHTTVRILFKEPG